MSRAVHEDSDETALLLELAELLERLLHERDVLSRDIALLRRRQRQLMSQVTEH